MSKERYETGKAPNVTITECAGDLVVRGWTENAVYVKGPHRADVGDETVTIQSTGSLSISVPEDSHVNLQVVSGDAVVKGLKGSLHLAQVMGDLALKNLPGVKIETVYGDLSARNVDGNLAVESIMGDFAARNVGDVAAGQVHGDLSVHYSNGSVLIEQAMGDVNLHTVSDELMLKQVHRDVNLNNLGGKLTVEQAHGDIRLKGGLAAGEHRCRADGDVVVRWPAGAPLNLIVSRGKVQDKLGLNDVSQQEGTFSGKLGDGDTTLVIEAGGRVILKEIDDTDWSGKFGAEFAGFGVELAGLGEQLSSEFSAHMQELGARMEEKFGHDFAQSMAEKAARRTERAVKRAMREAERMRVRATAWAPPPPAPPRPKKRAEVSPEERLKILKMLENGVISVGEAETLLSALEGDG